jgi:hypothetical protein
MMGELATCMRCGEQMLWGQTSPGGRPIPLDPITSARGNCEQIGATRAGAPIVRVLKQVEMEAESLFAASRYVPHAATCVPSVATGQPERSADAAAARTEALVRVERNGERDVLAALCSFIEQLPSGTVFTSDQVWFEMQRLGLEPHERRVLGAVMMRMRKQGIVMPTGEYRPSVRPECHVAPKPVYVRA